MARKKGVITQADAADLREKTKKIGEEVKRKFADLIPHRIDNNTVILINSHRDKAEQINRFMAKLERDRRNY